ncbi:PD-(D/E)XK motif protein [Streptomyces ginkgonis]|uniref:PD-(D/E)XK motif protein n=1 Tax=Streptomyces ginkgonis TaxID=1812259 RepID=UPI002176BE67|nr:PD-(D/E)XK motif protein [Streptomyces ginkgonis]
MNDQRWSVASLRLRELLEGLWDRLDRQAFMETESTMITAALEAGTPHGALRLGQDADGLRHLLVPIGPSDRVDDDLRSAGVHLTTRTLSSDDELPVRYADIACRRHDLAGTFTGLVADLTGLIAVNPDQAPSLIVRTLHAWRLLLGGTSSRWTVPRLAGLFAELVVLEDLLDMDPRSVRAWLGPLGCPQDFRGAHHAIEVKATVAAEGRIVHIHGADQLEAPENGTLALVWLRITESTAPGARSIPEILAACREKTGDLGALETRLVALGLPEGDEGLMSRTRFLPTEHRWYEVAGDFPRVVPQRFLDGALPTGVHGLEYQIDLDAVSHLTEREVVLQRLGADL